MLTYIERIELREKLQNSEIDIKSALKIYWDSFKEGQQSWHSKDWKERRAKIIKDKCEICGSKDSLTIQHRSHPKKYSEYLREVTRTYAQEHRDTNPVVDKNEFASYVIENYDYAPVPFCPHCKCSNPSKRVRKLPEYRCTSCRQEFDTPHYKSLNELIEMFYENEDSIEVRDKCFTSKNKWKNKQNLSNVRYWLQREFVKEQNSETIEREAFLLYLADDIKYLSFEDTITACKKCASGYDLYNVELCPKCKENYKGIKYRTCIQCLPEDKRKAALESIAFRNEWRKMERELGTD